MAGCRSVRGPLEARACCARQPDHRLGKARDRRDRLVERHGRARRFADDDRQHLHIAPEQRIERGERVADGAEIAAGDQNERQFAAPSSRRGWCVRSSSGTMMPPTPSISRMSRRCSIAVWQNVDDRIDVDAAPFARAPRDRATAAARNRHGEMRSISCCVTGRPSAVQAARRDRCAAACAGIESADHRLDGVDQAAHLPQMPDQRRRRRKSCRRRFRLR